MHACKANTLDVEAGGSEFRVIVGYIVSWRLAWASRKPVSTNKNNLAYMKFNFY